MKCHICCLLICTVSLCQSLLPSATVESLDSGFQQLLLTSLSASKNHETQSRWSGKSLDCLSSLSFHFLHICHCLFVLSVSQVSEVKLRSPGLTGQDGGKSALLILFQMMNQSDKFIKQNDWFKTKRCGRKRVCVLCHFVTLKLLLYLLFTFCSFSSWSPYISTT